jgi:hypothetical protein
VPPSVTDPEARGVFAVGCIAIPEKAIVPAAVTAEVTVQVIDVLDGAPQVPARPLVPALIVGVDAELKAKPLGVVNVTVPVEMSPAAVTSIEGPVSVVHAGTDALAAVSAEIVAPPVAGVTVAAARAGATRGAKELAAISRVRRPAIGAVRRRKRNDGRIGSPPDLGCGRRVEAARGCGPP